MADETGDTGTGTDTEGEAGAEEQAPAAESGAVPAGTVELLASLDAKYGDRFDAERRDELRERIAGFRESGETLSEANLENGDEPAFTFSAYRGGE